jgi:hypothetical protein
MPHLQLLRTFVFTLLSISYFGNAHTTTNRNHTVNPPAPSGTISCLIDGHEKTQSIQGFREIALDFYSKGSTDGILFANADDNKEGFQFKIKKSGTTKINHTGSGDPHCIINYYNPAGVTYTGRDVTVMVLSYTHNHLTGTFSGKLVNIYFKNGAAFPTAKGAKVAKNYPEFIQITNGKFDLAQ